MLNFINDVFLTFIEGVILLILYTYLADKKAFFIENKFKSIIFLLFYAIFSYWATKFLLPGIHSLAIFIFLVILLSFITDTKITSSAIFIILISVFFIVSELIVNAAAIFIIHTDLSAVKTNSYVKLAIFCIAKSLQLAIALLLFFCKKKFLKISSRSELGSFSNMIILQAFLFCLFILSLSYSLTYKKDISAYQILLFIISILFIILSYYDYKEREKLLAQSRKHEAQEAYVKNLEAFVSTLRREKHDYANHLSTLNVMCRLNKPDAIERIGTYLTNLTNQIQSSYQSFSTGNDYINALLAVKKNIAVENNIKLDVDFKEPIYKLNIPDSDLISIFGNLIDNAFEALESYPQNGDKTVYIATCIKNGSYIIDVSNNGPQINEKHLNRIFESGFSTKSDKKDHGFGLCITKQIVLGNHGIIKVSSSAVKTSFHMKFPVEPVKEAI